MKNGLFCAVAFSLLMVWSQPASAGPLYGTVRIGQAPAAGIEVSVACPSFERPPLARVVTDARGSFSLQVPASGRCEMRVRRGNQSGNPFVVFVSNNPLRFDFEIDGGMNRVR